MDEYVEITKEEMLGLREMGVECFRSTGLVYPGALTPVSDFYVAYAHSMYRGHRFYVKENSSATSPDS